MYTTLSLEEIITYLCLWTLVQFLQRMTTMIEAATKLIIVVLHQEEEHKSMTNEKDWMHQVITTTNEAVESMANWADTKLLDKKQRKKVRPWRLRRARKMVCSAAIMAMAARCAAATNCHPFDSDSTMIGIDNRCWGCITHVRSDIPGTLKQCNKAIKGFGGAKAYEVWTGTIHWDWEDDQGKIHTMVIPNSYYVPEGKVRLLSPQHWAQTRKNSEKRGGAGEMTTGTEVVLFWNDRQSRRTIPIDTHGNNVATFHLASGYKQYHNYCKECGTEHDHSYDKDPLLQHQAMPSTVMSNDEEGDDETFSTVQAPQWHHRAMPK